MKKILMLLTLFVIGASAEHYRMTRQHVMGIDYVRLVCQRATHEDSETIDAVMPLLIHTGDLQRDGRHYGESMTLSDGEYQLVKALAKKEGL